MKFIFEKLVFKKKPDKTNDTVYNIDHVKTEVETKRLIVECECSAELLVFEYTKETDPVEKNFNQELLISFYSYGHHGKKFTGLSKLKLIWKVITTGTPYEDDVILGNENIKKVRDFFNELT
jgi:hypothetical protein